MSVIETERLILRHLRPEDADALAALYADPEFMRFFDGLNADPADEARADVEWWLKAYETAGYGFYATVLKADDRFIGRCGLLTQTIDGSPELEVAYGIAPAYWGRGLATEAARALKDYAFRAFAPPRVISIVDTKNYASQRVAEKNGMESLRTISFHGHECFLYAV